MVLQHGKSTTRPTVLEEMNPQEYLTLLSQATPVQLRQLIPRQPCQIRKRYVYSPTSGVIYDAQHLNSLNLSGRNLKTRKFSHYHNRLPTHIFKEHRLSKSTHHRLIWKFLANSSEKAMAAATSSFCSSPSRRRIHLVHSFDAWCSLS